MDGFFSGALGRSFCLNPDDNLEVGGDLKGKESSSIVIALKRCPQKVPSQGVL